MTTPRYPQGCSAGSKDCGIASSPGDYAWNVNFNNGNANWNNQNNSGLVRAVRASECDGAVSFHDLYTAWRQARRSKKPSSNLMRFETRWADGLLDLVDRINGGQWQPAPPTCFIAKAPKAREIHAPDFADRIVHHWLVPLLERAYERTFVFDSFSNRKGKGTHAAVERLRSFVRQVHSGQGGGWYLQLDIHNFFNSIHRPTLYSMLKQRMERCGLPLLVRRITHALLRHSIATHDVHYASTPAERELVPPHKQLANAAPGCGIAIGNLSSQFFANVYLDALDQFVKHELRARRYVRYVDDFVIVHHDRAQLVEWRNRIEWFLTERLRLSLKAEEKLQPLRTGVDFLGYVLYPTHTLVRHRVIAHARAKLAGWERNHVRQQRMRATPAQYRGVQSIWNSYCGHFSHASTALLQRHFHRRFPWLRAAMIHRRFDHRLEGLRVEIPFHPDRNGVQQRMNHEVPADPDDLTMVLLDEGIEACDHGVPFDEQCDECDDGDWLVHEQMQPMQSTTNRVRDENH